MTPPPPAPGDKLRRAARWCCGPRGDLGDTLQGQGVLCVGGGTTLGSCPSEAHWIVPTLEEDVASVTLGRAFRNWVMEVFVYAVVCLTGCVLGVCGGGGGGG